jgi:hypothetical protein
MYYQFIEDIFVYVEKLVKLRFLTSEYIRVFLFKYIMALKLLKIKIYGWLFNKLYFTNYNDTLVSTTLNFNVANYFLYWTNYIFMYKLNFTKTCYSIIIKCKVSRYENMVKHSEAIFTKSDIVLLLLFTGFFSTIEMTFNKSKYLVS